MFKLPNSIKQPAARQAQLKRYIVEHFAHSPATPSQMSAAPTRPDDALAAIPAEKLTKG